VACFDTTFHATLSAAASTYAVPGVWRDRWPIRRYGFHGLSHAYAVGRACELGPGLRVVSCHLGSGASLCAARDGRAVDTTMGFTPLEGLVMATRSGTVDPGLVLWLVRVGGLAAEEVEQGLEHHAGLAGLGGGTGDMRELLTAVDGGDQRAGLAAGVGERSPVVRARATADLGYLGVAIDAAANEAAAGDADITAEGARARTLVVTAREDLEIAHQTRAAITGEPAHP
jgi:acetate kinase